MAAFAELNDLVSHDEPTAGPCTRGSVVVGNEATDVNVPRDEGLTDKTTTPTVTPATKPTVGPAGVVNGYVNEGTAPGTIPHPRATPVA